MEKKCKIIYLNNFIYILSDDEIKEGDWFIGDNISIKQCTLNNGGNINFKSGWYSGSTNCKKIIATTDTSLYQATGKAYKMVDGFKPTYKNLPQPSQQFIKKFVEEYNRGNIITDVLVEYELISNEEYFLNTINPDENVPYFDENLKINSKDDTITIKKAKDSYTREEVDRMLDEQASRTTAEMLEKFKDYKSREEVEILCRRAYREGQNYDAPDQCIMSDKISIEEFIRQNL